MNFRLFANTRIFEYKTANIIFFFTLKDSSLRISSSLHISAEKRNIDSFILCDPYTGNFQNEKVISYVHPLARGVYRGVLVDRGVYRGVQVDRGVYRGVQMDRGV